jgi:trans-2,3-dihydro-3-hydroxyanthranilate isomerase
MKLAFHTLDVFTKKPFSGNGLAVVIGADALSDAAMQDIAQEFNLSETVFVQAPENPANTAKVRIFMPNRNELPFAGHPTIGCAVLLASLKEKPGAGFQTEIRLEEKAGLVPVKVTREGGLVRGQLTAPRLAAVEPVPASEEASAAALGVERGEIGFDGYGPCILATASRLLTIPLASLDALKRARVSEPHFSRLLAEHRTFSAYMYARNGDGFRVRLFAPGEGIPEDPATGLAAASLPAQIHQAEHLSDGTHRWRLEQGIEMGRPSELRVEADVKASLLTAVRVEGDAVKVMEGTIDV